MVLFSVTDCEVMFTTVLLIILCKAVASILPLDKILFTIATTTEVNSDHFAMDMLACEDQQTNHPINHNIVPTVCT